MSKEVIDSNGQDILGVLGIDDINSNNISEDKKYMGIHGKLTYGGRNKIYGLLNATINVDTGDLIHLDLAFSNKDEVVYIEPSSKAFNRIFSKISDKEKLAGRKLKIYLLNNISKNETFLFVDLLNQGKQEEIKELLRTKLEDFILEAVSLTIYCQFKNREEIMSSHPNLLISEEDEVVDSEDEIIELDILPIIAPIKGKKISQFKKGDQILVEVTEESYDKYKYQIMNLIVDNEEKQVKGLIDYIEFNEQLKSYDIIIKFIANIYSQLLIEAEKELKLAIPLAEDLEEKSGNQQQDYESIKARIRQEIEDEIRMEMRAEVKRELEEELTAKIEQRLRIELEQEIEQRLAKQEEQRNDKEKNNKLFKSKPVVVSNKIIVNIFIGVSVVVLIILGIFYYFKRL